MPMLDPTRWQALSPHLDAAFEVTGVERESWLVALEARDPRLAADLRQLLAEHEALNKEGFLSAPPPHPTDPGLSRPVVAVTESGEFDSDRRQRDRRGSRIERSSPARKHFLEGHCRRQPDRSEDRRLHDRLADRPRRHGQRVARQAQRRALRGLRGGEVPERGRCSDARAKSASGVKARSSRGSHIRRSRI